MMPTEPSPFVYFFTHLSMPTDTITTPTATDTTTTDTTTRVSSARQRMNKEGKLLARTRDLVATLRAHTGYADDADLAALDIRARELEDATTAYAGKQATSGARKKQINAEAATARAAITREAEMKKDRVDAEMAESRATVETSYKTLARLSAKVSLGAKQKLLSDESDDNDAIAKLIK